MPTRILRSIVGSIVWTFVRYDYWRFEKMLRPLYEERIAFLRQPSIAKPPEKPYDDHLRSLIEYAQHSRPAETSLQEITVRLCGANFGAIHQTSFALTNLIFNIVASDAEHNTISVLRHEISRTFGTETPMWTKASISKMIHLDSTIRETLRVHSFANRGLLRMVTAKEGARTEDDFLLPKGTLLSLLGHPAHCDEEVFENPLQFDPFRFSRVREESASTPEEDTDQKQGRSLKQTLVSTGPHYLLFGHGKHACPGRFVVDFELKKIVTYILIHYDIDFPPEYEGRRPKTAWLAEACFPDRNGKIRVRRKNV